MRELALPRVTQETDYSCGPACALSILRYMGLDEGITEAELCEEMGATSVRGAHEADMIRSLSARWGYVTQYTDWDYDGLKAAVCAGAICILLLQAWADDRPPPRGYSRRTSEGHYVVATGVSARRAVFMDPGLRVRGTLSRNELIEQRWHIEHEVQTVTGRPNAYEQTPGVAIVVSGFAPKWRRVGRTRPIE